MVLRAGALTGLLNQPSAQVIDGSLKFDDTQKNHLLRTHTAGNTKTFTWAGWVKRDKYGGYQTIFGHVSGGSGQHYIDFGSDKIRFTRYVSSNEAALETTQVFRDTGWYHIVAVWDTTNSTANDRQRLYVNGEQITSFSTRVNPSQNYSGVINTAIEHGICRIPTLDQNYHACRMSQVYFMDGLALEPDNFGFTDPLTNIWKPKKYTGDFNGPADLKSEAGSFSATGDQVGGPIANAYDGNTGTPDGSTSGVTFWGRSGGTATQSGLSIPIGSTVRIYYNVNVGGGTISVNGTSRNANVPGGGNTSIEILDWTSGEVGSTLNSISIYSPNLGVGVYVSAILVDGVVLEDIPAGTNGFYLPMDGVTPVGQDQSGNGNDWTPTNFGGSVALDNPIVSGALPILNTLPGGTQAGVGVRTDSSYDNLRLALPYVGGAADVTTSIGSTSTSLMTSWSQNSSSFQNGGGFYNSALFMNSTSDYPRINFSAGAMNFMHNSTGTGTIEFWANSSSVTTGAVWASTSGGSDEVGFGIYSFTSGTEIGFFISKGVSGQSSSAATGKTPNGKWVHIAAVKTPTELRLYTDGVLRSKVDISSYAFSSSNSARNYIQHGSPPQQSGSRGWTGAYMQDFRVYEGLEKYTGTTVGTQYFVPASTSPDILPDTPSGVSGSSKLTKIIDGSVHFDGNGDYLEATSSTDFAFGTGDFTLEAYVYATSLPNTNNRVFCSGAGGSGDRTNFQLMVGSAGYLEFAHTTNYQTANGLIEPNKWYHIAATREGTSLRMFIDGVLHHTGTSSVNVTENGGVTIGREFGYSSYWNGFISNARVLKGTALYTANFTPPSAPLTNVTNTELLCCQSPTSATAAAVPPSGSITANGNAAAKNFNPFITDINTVRGQETVYATFNPIEDSSAGGGATLADGNLQINGSSSEQFRAATIPVSSGKWYFEIIQTAGTDFGPGVWAYPLSSPSSNFYQNENYRYNSNGGLYDESSKITDYSSFAVGDVIGTALDMDNGKVYFSKNGIFQNSADPAAGTGAAASDLDGTWIFGASTNGASTFLQANFGQKPFKFPPPEGFQPLNAANARPETVFVRPDQYVGVTTYKGSSGNVEVKNLEFKPDVVWIKQRNASGSTDDHVLIDTVRGRASSLYPSATYTPNTSSADRDLISFDRNGFTLGQTQQSAVNRGTSGNYVAWCWKAGGNKNTFNIDDEGFATAAAAGLDGGSINPTGASVGTKQGFSIIKADPSQAAVTISHGLGKKPAFIISKSLSQTYDWTCFHQSLGVSKLIRLNTGAAEQSVSNYWGSGMTTTTFGVASGNNANNQDMMYYLWADVPGLQKFGTYKGRSAQNFVELGFRPALIMLKNASNSSYTSYTFFAMFDSVRKDNHNPMQNVLFAGKSQAENLRGNGGSMSSIADFSLDFVSNGFTLRDNGASEINLNGDTYIYAAWAETPSISLFGGGANAR